MGQFDLIEIALVEFPGILHHCRLLTHLVRGSTMNTSHRNLGTLLLLLIISVYVAIPAFAFQNEPDGFRGIKWGTDIRKLPDMVLLERDGDIKIYYRKFDQLKIENVHVDEIVYRFYKNRFCAVHILFDGFSNFTRLKSVLSRQHGQGENPNRHLEKYFWLGANVNIDIEYNEIERKGGIRYFVKSSYEEQKKGDKEKARKGARD